MSYIQNFFTSRDNNANAETYVGQVGRLWWDPDTNQIYSSNGNTPGGIPLSGGGGVPGGANTQVQFNDDGAFGGSANFTFDQVSGALTAVSFSSTGNITGDYFIGNGSQLTGLPATYGNANVAAYLPTYTGNLVSLAGNIITIANISGAYIIGNGSQLTGVTASAANIFNTVVANATPLVADSPNDTVTLASGNNLIITGNAATDTATFAVSDAPVFSGNVTANYFVGDGSVLAGVMADRGADLNNWDNMTQMGVYTVNRASWSGTTGTPLDSQVYVGLVEVKNSTNTALAQVFYPGTVESGNVKIQWNRTYWSGSWSSWLKIVNDDQVVVGGSY